jgi:hypothetical protein
MDIDLAFDDIVAAMKRSEEAGDDGQARQVAEGHGLVKLPAPELSQGETWELAIDGRTLWFQSRWHDPSQAFSIQRDIRILAVEIRDHSQAVRRAEVRFPD